MLNFESGFISCRVSQWKESEVSCHFVLVIRQKRVDGLWRRLMLKLNI
jgi:hypothetical protein